MGRWAGSGKTTCESVKALDVNWLRRRGELTPGRWSWVSWSCGGEPSGSIQLRAEHDAVVLHYKVRDWAGGEWEPVEQRIAIERTPCRFGGSRPWFRCTVYSGGRYCGRRVAKVYGAGKLFACRHCYRLAYESQHESPRCRGLSTAQHLRRRLGGDAGIDDLPEKPPRMHWRTYNRICDRIIACEERADSGLVQWAMALVNGPK
jgi:hypothetical protein